MSNLVLAFPPFSTQRRRLSTVEIPRERTNVVVNGLNLNGDIRNHHAGVPPLQSCGSSLSDTMAVHSGCPPRPLVYYLARASYPAPAATPSCARLH